MAQSTTNVIVGAANVAIGDYSSDWNGTGDTLWNALKTKAGSKDFRGYIRTLPTNGIVSIVGAIQQSPSVTGAGTCTFRDVGLTQEGVEVQYQPDFGEVEVDQILDTARLFKQRMTVSVATTFAEGTLENLIDVWAQSEGTRYSEQIYSGSNSSGVFMSGGTLGEAPNEKALFFVGNAPDTQTTYKQRVYLANRALSVEASSHGYKRNEATVFPVTFRLLPDTSASYSAYGRVVDVA
jgi:hypothetical protein